MVPQNGIALVLTHSQNGEAAFGGYSLIAFKESQGPASQQLGVLSVAGKWECLKGGGEHVFAGFWESERLLWKNAHLVGQFADLEASSMRENNRRLLFFYLETAAAAFGRAP